MKHGGLVSIEWTGIMNHSSTIADEPFIFVVRPKESAAKGFSRMLVVVPFDMFGTHLQYLTMCRLHICMYIYIL